MNEPLPYPVPEENADNRPLLEAWREGRLALPHCLDCEQTFYYPRAACPHCWGENLEWRDLSGEGRIVAFSLVYRPNHAAFNAEVPIVLAEIGLSEGVSLIARVVSNDPHAVQSGMAVHLLSGERARCYPLPTFRLA